jgi:hypothetical protein
MKSRRSLANHSFAGVVLALTIATGTTPSLRPIEREVIHSYRSVVQVYDRARAWSLLLRWWVDPEYAARPTRHDREDARSSPKTEDVCQAHPADAHMRKRAYAALVSSHD